MIKYFTKYTKKVEAEALDIENAKQLTYENMRRIYKAYLHGQGLGRNTVNSVEYSRAVTPPVRQTRNRLSGPTETASASLLA